MSDYFAEIERGGIEGEKESKKERKKM